MNRLITVIVAILATITVSANKYVHYYMNDGTFHGFYIYDQPIIQHNAEGTESNILINGLEYSLSLQMVDRIEIEDGNISQDFTGDYRIYEKNSEGNFHRVIVDNRASLFASKNGDFGANDTILAVSNYNNHYILLFTDDASRIKSVFTGTSLYSIVYLDNKIEDIIEFNIDGRNISHSANLTVFPERIKYNNIESPRDIHNFFKDFNNIIELVEDPLSGLKNLAQNYTELGVNPELHNQFLIVDGLILARDFANLAAATAALFGTGGLSWYEFINSINSLYGSMDSLMDDMFPESELIRRYEDYYRLKYDIDIKSTLPTDVSCTSANLNGHFSATNGNCGSFKIIFKELLGQDPFQELSPIVELEFDNSYLLYYSIENLKPGTNYFYSINYECFVDGLKLTFSSDPIDFKTLTPEATTLGIVDKCENSAKIKCSFKNVPNNSVCGILYGVDEISNISQVSPIDGTQIVVLSGLQPSTSYQYCAFIQYGGRTYYGEILNFITDEFQLNVETGDCINITENSATVNCYFNGPKDANYGIEYWQYSQHKEKIYFDFISGNQPVTISGLKSSTSYSYRAFIEFNDNYTYGKTKKFITSASWLDCYCRYWYYTKSSHDSNPVMLLLQDGTNRIWNIGSLSYDFESTWSYNENKFTTSYYDNRGRVTITYDGELDFIEEYPYYKLSGTIYYLYKDGTTSSEPFVLYGRD